MKFNEKYLKYITEINKATTPNEQAIGKRIYQELMTYLDDREKDMDKKAYKDAKKIIKKLVIELEPENLMKDLEDIGEIVGYDNYFTVLVGNIISIANTLIDPDEEEEEEEEEEETDNDEI